MTTETPEAALAEAAEQARISGTRLRCLVFAPIPTLPFNAYGGLPYAGAANSDGWPSLLDAARNTLKDRADTFEQVLADANASGGLRPVLAAIADLREHVTASARTVDVAYIAPELREEPEIFYEMVHAVLFHSPVGIVLNTSRMTPLKRVFVAWNDSPAAARAVHAALPFLRAAEEVCIGCFDPSTVLDTDEEEPGADMAAWLSHSGCKVTLGQYPSGGNEIGSCVLQRAAETGSELVVMGAYGHSRMRQAVFGGTTRTLLEQTEMPVLMAH
ncbi:MAG: universal stress protein [Pseudomonadota bacterium]